MPHVHLLAAWQNNNIEKSKKSSIKMFKRISSMMTVLNMKKDMMNSSQVYSVISMKPKDQIWNGNLM